MKIDKRLNLALEVTRSDGSRLFVHSTSISADLFDRYWEPISETVAAIFKGEHGIVTGPRIAHKMLRKHAQRLGVWDTSDGVKAGLLPEIRRLTSVLLVAQNGWEQFPLEDALRRELLDANEADEIEGRVVFFICCWAVILTEDQPQLLARAAELWHVRLESLSCTDLLNSLRTSTADENTGAKVTA